MNIRAIVALIMGLLLQWSLVRAFPDPWPTKSCGNGSAPMSCCSSKQACPCADQGGSDEKPAPLAPPAPELKLVFIGSSATADPEPTVAIAAAVNASPVSRAESTAGFPGVPLSVAFCSFVI